VNNNLSDPYGIDWPMVAIKFVWFAIIVGLLGVIGWAIYCCHVEEERVQSECSKHGESVTHTYKGPTFCVREDGTVVKR